jgi:hypothetical protein
MKIVIFWVVARWFIAWLIFDPEVGGYVTPKRWFIHGLHGAVCQKTATFIHIN